MKNVWNPARGSVFMRFVKDQGVGILLICMVCLFFACAVGGQKTCILAIYADDAVILPETDVVIYGNKTVFDVIRQQTRANRIHMEFSGTGMAVYVKGINNLYEFDKGPESGWVFYKNGEYSTKGCGTVRVEDGDHIVWQYVTENTEP